MTANKKGFTTRDMLRVDCLAYFAEQKYIETLQADAVEVVRCKDCKHLNTAIGAIIVNGEKESVTCDYWCNATYPHVTVQDTEHFCSYGERRNNE